MDVWLHSIILLFYVIQLLLANTAWYVQFDQHVSDP